MVCLNFVLHNYYIMRYRTMEDEKIAMLRLLLFDFDVLFDVIFFLKNTHYISAILGRARGSGLEPEPYLCQPSRLGPRLHLGRGREGGGGG